MQEAPHPFVTSGALDRQRGRVRELEELLGREVDLVSRSAVERSRNWIRREEILGSARTLYAA